MRAFEFVIEDPKKISLLQKDIENLPQDIDPRLLQKMQDLVAFAKKGKATSVKQSIFDSLKKISDPDLRKHLRVVARTMLGNDLTKEEIKNIIEQLKNDTCIDQTELLSPSSDLSKIIPYYNTSQNTRDYFDDMLMYQPGQRIGPGEMLLAIHSRSLTKGTKGDIKNSSGKDIEVKGGRTPGRFRDQDLIPSTGEYQTKVSAFIEKYKNDVPMKTKHGYSMGHLVNGILSNPDLAGEIAEDAASIVRALFGNSEYIENIKNSLMEKNSKQALYFHGLANLKRYFDVKGGSMGVLFINAKASPATTHYADSLEDLLEFSNITVTSAYPITPGVLEAFPKISAIQKSS